MRPLSGRILVPVVLSVLVFALVVTGLVVRANTPGVTVTAVKLTNPATVSFNAPANGTGTSGTWNFSLMYTDTNTTPGGGNPTVYTYTIVNNTTGLTVQAATSMTQGVGTIAGGMPYTASYTVPVNADTDHYTITYNFTDSASNAQDPVPQTFSISNPQATVAGQVEPPGGVFGASPQYGAVGGWNFKVTYTDTTPGATAPALAQYYIYSTNPDSTLNVIVASGTALPAASGGTVGSGLIYQVAANLNPGGSYSAQFFFQNDNGENANPYPRTLIADANTSPNPPGGVSMTPAPGTGMTPEGNADVAGTTNTGYTFFATAPADADPRDNTPAYTPTLTAYLYNATNGTPSLGNNVVTPAKTYGPYAMAAVNNAGAGNTYWAYIPGGTLATGTYWLGIVVNDTRTNNGNNLNFTLGQEFQVVDSGQETFSWNNTGLSNLWNLNVSPDDGSQTAHAGSSSSQYTFHVEYQDPNGLPPRSYYLPNTDTFTAGDRQTGVVLYLPDPTQAGGYTSPPTAWLPHFMVIDNYGPAARSAGVSDAGPTPAQCQAGVWYICTVSPQSNVGIPFTPDGTGYPGIGGGVDSNLFTAFSFAGWSGATDVAMPPWSPPWTAPNQGVMSGTVDYKFAATDDYRPTTTDYILPSSAYPNGSDVGPAGPVSGTQPSDYTETTSLERFHSPDTTLQPLSLNPLLARGGRSNVLLNGSPSWLPESYKGTPLPLSNPYRTGVNFWPLINEGHSRTASWMPSTFYIKYYDANNNPPAYVAVMLLHDPSRYGDASYWQNPANYDYHQMTIADSSHQPGVWYSYSSTLPPGVSRLWFKAFNGIHTSYYPSDPANNLASPGSLAITCGDTFTPNTVNNPPVLTNASVAPTTEPTGGSSPFTYSVTYSDKDNDAPRYAFVDIYDPMLQPATDGSTPTQAPGGTPLPGAVATVSANQITAAFTNVTVPAALTQATFENLYQGWYVKMINGGFGSGGTTSSRGHYYRIASVTGGTLNPAVGSSLPYMSGTMTINIDQATSVDDLTKINPSNDGVAVGDQFEIVYRGTMSGTGSTYTTGVPYTFSFNQFYAGVARSLRYGFTFADNWGISIYAPPGEMGELVNLPAGDHFGVESSFSAGPTLTPLIPTLTLSAPAVSATTPDGAGDPQPTVDPNAGTSATPYMFRVKYTNADGTAPTTIQVQISNSAAGYPTPATGNFGTFAMIFPLNNNDGVDPKLGRTYWTTVNLPALASPTGYAFSFYATDGRNVVQPSSASGWNIATDPAGTSKFVADSTGQYGQFGPAVYPDVAPTVLPTAVTVGATTTYPVVTATDAKGNPISPITLTNLHLDSTITFNVTYTNTLPTVPGGDPPLPAGLHGNAPQYLYLYLDQYTNDANHQFSVLSYTGAGAYAGTTGGPTNPNNVNYAAGVNYTFKIPASELNLGGTGVALGAHQFFFLASDGANTARWPASGFSTATSTATDLAPPPATGTIGVELPGGVTISSRPPTLSGATVSTTANQYLDTTHTPNRIVAPNGSAFTVSVVYQSLDGDQPTTLQALVYEPGSSTPTIYDFFNPPAPNPAYVTPTVAQIQAGYQVSMILPAFTTPGVYRVRFGCNNANNTTLIYNNTETPPDPTNPVPDIQTNVAPSAPSPLLAPTNGADEPTATPTLQWTAASDTNSYDQDASKLTYVLQVDTKNTFDSTAGAPKYSYGSPAIPAGATSFALTTALTTGKWYWRVAAVDQQGLQGAWSSVWSFTYVPDAAPTVPTDLAPNNNQVTPPTPATVQQTGTPELTWTASTDAPTYDPPNTLTYVVDIATNVGMTNHVAGYPVTVGPFAGAPSFTPATALADDGHFFWTVTAKNAQGLTSAPSGVADFWVNSANEAPGTPALASQGGVASTPATVTAPGGAVAVTWTAAVPPDADPGTTGANISYKIRVADNDNAAHNPALWTNPKDYTVAANQPLTEAILLADLGNRYNVPFYWAVQAEYTPLNGTLPTSPPGLTGPPYASAWSGVWSFTVTGSHAPNVPVAPFAPSGANAYSTSLQPTLTWTAATPTTVDAADVNKVYYNVQVSTDPTFGSVLISGTVPAVAPYTTPTPTQWTLPASPALVNGTQYFWRVQAESPELLTSAWTAAQSFWSITNDQAPSRVTAGFTPSDAATPPPYAVFANGNAATINLNDGGKGFAWTAATNPNNPPVLADKLHYVLQLSQDQTFGTVTYQYTSADDTANLTLPAGVVLNTGDWYWRVQAVDTVGSASAWSATQTFHVDKTAPTAPAAGFTVTDETGTAYPAPLPYAITDTTPTLGWSAGADVNVYDPIASLSYVAAYSQDATFATGVTTLPATAAGVTQVAIPAGSALAVGTWHWHVRTLDAEGRTSAWSADHQFTVEANVAPKRPTGLAPAGGAIQSSATPPLTWSMPTPPDPNLSDPLGTLKYEVDVATDAAFTNQVAGYPVAIPAGVQTYTPAKALAENGHFYWRVQAVDDEGAVGNWSVTADFYVDVTNEPPNAPPAASLLPANGTLINTLTPTLQWGAGSDPDPGTTAADLTYVVQVADNSGFIRPLIATPVTPSLLDPSVIQYPVPAGKLRAGTQLWWRVRTVDQFGAKSPWVSSSFTVQNDQAPLPPVAGFSPAGGAPVATLSPTLQWSAGSDPDPLDTAPTLYYQVQLTLNQTTWAPNGGTALAPTAPGVTSVPVRLTAADNGKHFYWRVRTFDSTGLNSDWSAVQDFWSISADRPPTQVKAGFVPALNTVFTSGNIGSLSWTASTEPNNPPVTTDLVHYVVQLSQDQTFATVTYQYTTADSTATQAVAATLNAGAWYWRVEAIDSLGTTSVPPWSPVQQFSVALPVAPNPVSGGFKVDGYLPTDFTPTGIVLTYFQPLLTWEAATGNTTYDTPSTLTYRVQISSSSTFGTTAADAITAAGMTQHKVGAGTLTAGTWYWRVQTQTAEGLTAAWSTPQVFVLMADQPPSAPTNPAPAANSILTTTTPTFTWTASTDPIWTATQVLHAPSTLVYHVQISTVGFHTVGFSRADIIFDGKTAPGVTQLTSSALADHAQYWWRVQALDSQGVAGPWTDPNFWIYITPEPPVAPSSGFVPAAGAQVPTSTPTLSWNAGSDPNPADPPSTLTYRVRLADNVNFVGATLFPATAPGVTQLPATTLPNIQYFWEVLTVDPQGLMSPWSAPQNFTTRQDAAPRPPVAPFAPSGPNPITTTHPVMTWGAGSDSDAAYGYDLPSELRYEVQLVTDTTYQASGFGGVLTADLTTAAGKTQLTVAATLLNDTKYWWRARTLDTFGLTSDWATTQSFWVNTKDLPPTAPPGGFSPTNGTLVPTTTPTLMWDASTDPNPGATSASLSYIVQLSSTADFSKPTYQFTTPAGVTQVTTVALPNLSNWYWRVEAVDPYSVLSPWSVVNYFTVSTNSPLPTLSAGSVTPASGTAANVYQYKVTYTDTAGAPPSSVNLQTDGVANYVMQLQNPTNPNYATGVVYVITVPGNKLGIGNHYFRFMTDRGVADPATGTLPGPSIGLYSISGKVTNTAGGGGLAGVEVSAGGQHVTTAGDGTYTIPNLRQGTYTVTPLLAEYTFNPTSTSPVTVNDTSGNVVNINFTGTQDIYTISGKITDSTGAVLPAVQVTAGGASMTTGADGMYTFSGLVAGTYTVTPALAEYLFTPVNRTFSVNQTVGSASGKNFVGTLQHYSIAGYVRDGQGVALPAVQMTAGNLSTATDANGHYEFDNLAAGMYTITPALAEHSFTPASRSVTVNQATGNATAQNFTGTVVTYSIAGIITENGNPVTDALVTAVDGAVSKSAHTAVDGTYTLAGLVAGTYTVTPTKNERLFTPTSRAVTVNQTNGSALGTNFTASTRTYAISGTITLTGGTSGLGGVTVTVGKQTTQTAGDGTYSVGGLLAGTYTVTPSLAEYTFAPTSLSETVSQTTNPGGVTGANFVATVDTYSIAGTITNSAGGAALAGVQVTLTPGGQTTTTGTGGAYKFSSLVAGTYTVTPSLTEWLFTPASLSATVNHTVGSASGKDFTATQRTYSISGSVTKGTATGPALSGVLIKATGSGGATKTTYTAADGTYNLNGLPADKYTVTPSLAEYTFAPTTLAETVSATTNSGGATGANFVATMDTYTISGMVTGSGAGLAGVSVAGGGQTATTLGDGTYRITGLLAGTYTVTPTKTEYLFTPPTASETVNETKGSAPNVNFTVTLRTYTISGTVTNNLGAALPSVTITYGGKTTTTGTDGTYTISGLLAGTYDLVPSRTEYSFSPKNQSETVNQSTAPSGSLTKVNFVGTPNTYSVSGTILTSAQAPIAGVQVTSGDPSGRFATTGTDGKYTITGVPVGTWTVTPFIDTYNFTPTSRTVTVNGTVGDATGVNFTGTPVTAVALAAGINLVSVPYTPSGNTSPSAVFGTAQVSRVTTDSSTTVAPASADFLSVAPGKAYLVQVPTARTIRLSGTPAPSDQPFSFSLQAGWNLIGNPWNAPLPFAHLTAASSALATTGQVYNPATGSYLVISDRAGVGVARTTVLPCEAVWVKAAHAVTLAVAPPAVGAAAATAVAPQQLALGDKGWTVPIVVGSGNRADLTTVAGVSSNGAQYAADNAPALPGSVDAYLVSPQGAQLAQLVQPAAAGPTKFNFVVTTDLNKAEIAVSLPDLSSVPNDLTVTLSDLDSGQDVYARTTSRYTFVSSAKGVTVRHFQLTVEPASVGSLVVTAAAAQQQAGGLVVAYSVSGPCQVTARVVNIAGRTIRTLVVAQVVSAGANTIPWNLRNDAGSLVPTGQYLIRLEAVATNGQRVSTICAAQVMR